MKLSIPLIACLLMTGIAHGQKVVTETPKELNPNVKKDVKALNDTKADYIIMAAPWRAKIGSPGYVRRSTVRAAIIAWGNANAAPFSLLADPRFNTDIESVGACLFGARLTAAQAVKLQTELGVFVSPNDEVVPVPIVTQGGGGAASPTTGGTGSRPAPTANKNRPAPNDRPKGGPKGTPKEGDGGTAMLTADQVWAKNCVVSGTITRESLRVPVLYVVDTGVQTFLTGGTGWHPQLKSAIETGKLRIRQGRVPHTLGTWPPTSNNGTTWETTGADNLLTLPTSFPFTPPTTSPTFNPHLDINGHGTKITSAAVGSTVGTLANIVTASGALPIDIQSIRVYNNSTTYSVDVVNGIYRAIQAHLVRGANAPSVMLMASRTTSAFNQTFETALWWAWKQGIVCVVAAGNVSGTVSPNSRWYASAGVIASPATTSPSRYDWSLASATYWPNWTSPVSYPGVKPSDNPWPNEPYLVLVGGTNAEKNNPDRAGYWSSSCQGRDIDILAPAGGVAASVTSTASDPDALLASAGTSLSAGYVAGAALAFVATTTDNGQPWPSRFRSWLLPNTNPITGSTAADDAPCVITTNQGAYNSPSNTANNHLPSSYNFKLPRILINSNTDWP